MRTAGIKKHSLVDGEGIRYTIFVQGCHHHCKGCHNPETWDFDGGYDADVRMIANDIRGDKFIDGITLSGGDPFFQQEECMALLDLLPNVNVWVYTGFEYDDIKDTALAKRADVLVVGPFMEHLKCEGRYYGSWNQRIVRKELD